MEHSPEHEKKIENWISFPNLLLFKKYIQFFLEQMLKNQEMLFLMVNFKINRTHKLHVS